MRKTLLPTCLEIYGNIYPHIKGKETQNHDMGTSQTILSSTNHGKSNINIHLLCVQKYAENITPHMPKRTQEKKKIYPPEKGKTKSMP